MGIKDYVHKNLDDVLPVNINKIDAYFRDWYGRYAFLMLYDGLRTCQQILQHRVTFNVLDLGVKIDNLPDDKFDAIAALCQELEEEDPPINPHSYGYLIRLLNILSEVFTPEEIFALKSIGEGEYPTAGVVCHYIERLSPLYFTDYRSEFGALVGSMISLIGCVNDVEDTDFNLISGLCKSKLEALELKEALKPRGIYGIPSK